MSINKFKKSKNWYDTRWNKERPLYDNPVYKMRLEYRLKILGKLVPKRGCVLVIGTGKGYDLKPLIDIKNIIEDQEDLAKYGNKFFEFENYVMGYSSYRSVTNFFMLYHCWFFN